MVENIVADLDIEEVLGEPDYPIQDLQNFNPDVTALGVPFIISTVVAYGIAQEQGLERVEEALRKRMAKAKDGRVNKTDALYSPIAPPPGAWDYRCRNCRFYVETDDEERGGKCEIVGHQGDPLGGRYISPEAWCALWMPLEGTEFLTYIKNRLEGRTE